MIAHHYSSALELTRAAGADDPELARRARTALRDAGDRASSLSALAQGERYYSEALVLSDPTEPDHAELLLA